LQLHPLHWSRTTKLVAAFATLYVVWGSTYLAIRIGLQAELPPALFAGLRLVPAGLILLAVALARGTRPSISARDYRTTAIVGILLLCGGMYGTFLAEQHITSGMAALIVALLPLWIAGAESLLPDMERPSAVGYAGLVLGFCGLGILLYPKLGDVRATSGELTGIAIQVVATWLWTAGSIISKRRPLRVDGMVATGYEMLTAGAVLVALGLGLGELPSLHITAAGAGALLYLIVIGSALAFTAFMWLLRNAPASKVMTYAYVNPVVAVFLGWLVLAEPVDTWELAGMAVIVAGVALATAAPTRPPRVAPTS
jgi:drug/metabolite transporter (DMT)-like permease